jgi:hypothetical protein
VPTRIELLKQAGFSDGEIGDWATSERRRMQQTGFTDNEIDEEFGVTRPPNEVPAAFIERLKQGNALHRILGAAGEYAQDYFGDEPLGFSPENTEALRKLGVVGDLIIPAAKPVDALLRSVPAGIAGLGAGLGQAVEEGQDAALAQLALGPRPDAKGKAARDFAQLAQIAALLWGTNGRKTGATRVPAANDTPASALPRAEDFRNAAAAISGTPASFRTEQKLLRLWSDHGIPPAEVAGDALRDPSIGEAIRSDSEKLPDAYAGTNRTTTATSARPNVPAQLAESAEANSATVPPESKAAPIETDNRSSANPNASEPARMIAEAKPGRMGPPPPRPQRPFTKDYPEEPATDAQGQLLADIEGRLLGAKFVAGRQFSGQADVPLSLKDIKEAIAEVGIGLYQVKDTHPDVAKTLRKAVRGFYDGSDSDNDNGPPNSRIFLNIGPKARDRDLVIAHEFGHAIDHLAGYLSATLTREEIAELSFVYGHLRSRGKSRQLLQPENFGYPPKFVNSELVAEGFRAYMTDPNYFKTEAPKAAARFRAAVNANPYLRHAIQFNSLGAIGLIGAGVRDQDRDDQ